MVAYQPFMHVTTHLKYCASAWTLIDEQRMSYVVPEIKTTSSDRPARSGSCPRELG